MAGNFVQLRRGILRHVLDGRISILQFGAYCLILLEADASDGSWLGTANRLAGDGGISFGSADHILGKLCEAGYIASLRKQGQRGNKPYVIDKYLVTVGPMTGRHVNAAESAKQGQVCYYRNGDNDGESNGDNDGVRDGESDDLSRHQDNKTSIPQENQSSRERVAASPESSPESDKPETPERPPVDEKPQPPADWKPQYEKPEDVPRAEQAFYLTRRLFACLGKPKNHLKSLPDWERQLTPLCDQFEFPEMYAAMKWATREDTFWSGVIKRAENWVKNADKIMDAYRAHLRGKATYERNKKQEAAKVDAKKQAPSNYGTGQIKLEGTYEL